MRYRLFQLFYEGTKYPVLETTDLDRAVGIADRFIAKKPYIKVLRKYNKKK